MVYAIVTANDVGWMSLAYTSVLTAAVSNARKEERISVRAREYKLPNWLCACLAVMVGLASGQTQELQSIGVGYVNVLNGSFHMEFIGAAPVSAAAVVLSLVSIRRSSLTPPQPQKKVSTMDQ